MGFEKGCLLCLFFHPQEIHQGETCSTTYSGIVTYIQLLYASSMVIMVSLINFYTAKVSVIPQADASEGTTRSLGINMPLSNTRAM